MSNASRFPSEDELPGREAVPPRPEWPRRAAERPKETAAEEPGIVRAAAARFAPPAGARREGPLLIEAPRVTPAADDRPAVYPDLEEMRFGDRYQTGIRCDVTNDAPTSCTGIVARLELFRAGERVGEACVRCGLLEPGQRWRITVLAPYAVHAATVAEVTVAPGPK